MEFNCSLAWRKCYPGAAVGILALENAHNPKRDSELEAHKGALEAKLRRQFGDSDRATLRQRPILQAYHNHYKHFKKSYHVQLQLESIVFKGKSIPRVAALVEAMFMAELKNQLLTAGHDLTVLAEPVGVDVASGDERYVCINGQAQTLKAGDMFIADAQGIMSSILYGPDRRTQIRPQTTAALFTVYAPAGIDETRIGQHLDDIKGYVALFAPELRVMEQRVFVAQDDD